MKRIIFCVIALICLATSVKAQEQHRPSLITDDLYAPENQAHKYTGHHAKNRQDALLWHKALLSMGIPNASPSNESYYRNDCHYDTAFGVLKGTRSLIKEGLAGGKLVVNDNDTPTLGNALASGMKAVILKSDITAYVIPSQVYAYPTPAQIIWMDGSYIYSIKSKSGSEEELIKSANLLINTNKGK